MPDAAADPKLIKLVRALDAERQLRLRAEQQSRAYRAQLAMAKRRLAMRTNDAKAVEHGASC